MFGDGLAVAVLSGIVAWIVAAVFIPPAVIAGLVWLALPRFGVDASFLYLYIGTLVLWVPTFIIWVKRS